MFAGIITAPVFYFTKYIYSIQRFKNKDDKHQYYLSVIPEMVPWYRIILKSPHLFTEVSRIIIIINIHGVWSGSMQPDVSRLISSAVQTRHPWIKPWNFSSIVFDRWRACSSRRKVGLVSKMRKRSCSSLHSYTRHVQLLTHTGGGEGGGGARCQEPASIHLLSSALCSAAKSCSYRWCSANTESNYMRLLI